MADEKISYENKEQTPNNVGVTDELGVDMIKGQLLNLYEEKKAFTKGLDHAQKNLKNFETQWNIDKRLYELQLENWGIKDEHKTHKLHDIEEYWELSKEQFMYSKVRPDTHQSEKMIADFNSEIETAENRLKAIEEEIIKVKEQITSLGETPEEEVVQND